MQSIDEASKHCNHFLYCKVLLSYILHTNVYPDKIIYFHCFEDKIITTSAAPRLTQPGSQQAWPPGAGGRLKVL